MSYNLFTIVTSKTTSSDHQNKYNNNGKVWITKIWQTWREQMLEKWCQHSSYTELPQTFNLLKKKKRVSAKYSKTGYACIRNPVLVYRNGQTSEQLLKLHNGFLPTWVLCKNIFPQASWKRNRPSHFLLQGTREMQKCSQWAHYSRAKEWNQRCL